MEDESTEDIQHVREMLYQLGKPHLCAQIERQPTRLGNPRNNKDRPMKVEFKSERAVQELIHTKKDLMYTSNFFKIFINNDLSKDEREKERNERRGKRNL